jgi:hypothetical protein
MRFGGLNLQVIAGVALTLGKDKDLMFSTTHSTVKNIWSIWTWQKALNNSAQERRAKHRTRELS